MKRNNKCSQLSLNLAISAICFLSLGSSTWAKSFKIVPVTDERIFFTTENWVVIGNDRRVEGKPTTSAFVASENFKKQFPDLERKSVVMSTNSPGAYFKMGFTGTSLQVVLDTSLNVAPDELPKLGVEIDGGPTQWVTVEHADAEEVVTLVSDLPKGSHQIRVSLDGLGYVDRWNRPVDQLQLKRFLIDRHAKIIDAKLEPKRMVVYGDSITEGAALTARPNTVANKVWSQSWDAVFAKQTHSEVSVVAFQAQGYGHSGQGGVPDFARAFTSIRRNVPRVFSAADYVVINQGTNGGASSDEVLSVVKRMRAVYPAAKLVLVVPFGGFAEDAYQSAYEEQVKTDSNILLFNLGGEGQNIASTQTADPSRIHPNAQGHLSLGTMLSEQFNQAVPFIPVEAPAPQHGFFYRLFHRN